MQLDGKSVHIVTVNDYLAKRDSEWMGNIYKFLGLMLAVLHLKLITSNRTTKYHQILFMPQTMKLVLIT